MFKLTILPQENNSNCQFNGQTYMTRNFIDAVVPYALLVAEQALQKIRFERVPIGADYLQVFEVELPYGKKVRFWVIDDGDHITVLLPEDY